MTNPTKFAVVDVEDSFSVLSEHDTEEEARQAAWTLAKDGWEGGDDELDEASWGDDAPGWSSIGFEREAMAAFGPTDTLPRYLEANGVE